MLSYIQCNLVILHVWFFVNLLILLEITRKKKVGVRKFFLYVTISAQTHYTLSTYGGVGYKHTKPKFAVIKFPVQTIAQTQTTNTFPEKK